MSRNQIFDGFKSQSVGLFFFFFLRMTATSHSGPSYSISRDFLSSPSPPSARLNLLHRTYRLRTLPSSRTTHIFTFEDSLFPEKQILSESFEVVG